MSFFKSKAAKKNIQQHNSEIRRMENHTYDAIVLQERMNRNAVALNQQQNNDDFELIGQNMREQDLYKASLLLEKSEQEGTDFIDLAKKQLDNSLFVKIKKGKIVAKSKSELKETKMQVLAYRKQLEADRERMQIQEGSDYFKEQLKKKYACFQIEDIEIKEFLKKELKVKTLSEIEAEYDYASAQDMISEQDSLEPATQEQVRQYGAASRVHHFPAIVAEKIVKESKGLLAMIPNGDYTYKLCPSLPAGEFTYENPLTGKISTIKHFRETYNLFCKYMADCMLKGQGTDQNPLFQAQNPENHFLDEKGELPQDVRDSLMKMGATEELLKDFIQLGDFFSAPGTGISEFGGEVDGYVGKTQMFDSQQNLEEMDYSQGINEYNDDLKMADVLSEKEKEQILGGKEPLNENQIKEEIKGNIKEFKQQRKDVKEELEKIQNMDIKSERIPLFGACSSNALFMSNVSYNIFHASKGGQLLNYQLNYHSHGANAGFVQNSIPLLKCIKVRLSNNIKNAENQLNKLKQTNVKTQELNQIERKINSAKSKIANIDKYFQWRKDNPNAPLIIQNGNNVRSADRIVEEALKIFNEFQTFNHHATAIVYQNEKYTFVTEAFAAERNQLMTSPLQYGSSYVGLYTKTNGSSSKSFEQYYGSDMGVDFGLRGLKANMLQNKIFD